MTTPVDICNRALSEIGSRVLISSLTDTSNAAVQCNIHYNATRQQLIRCAPWTFTRKTAPLTLLGSMYNTPPNSQYPWEFMYQYPADCEKVRYTLFQPVFTDSNNQPVTGQPLVPWPAPSRTWRYIVANDDSTGTDRKVILSNVCYATLVYNKDIQNPDLWDSLFQNAMVAAIKNKVVLAITGNAGMKGAFAEECDMAIKVARAADANEAISTAIFTPDWIQARARSSYASWGYGGYDGNSCSDMGFWGPQWDSMSWSS